MKRIIEYLHAYQEKKPKYLPAYALEMQIIMSSQLFGNSPEIAKKNYYIGADLKEAMQVLNQRKFS